MTLMQGQVLTVILLMIFSDKFSSINNIDHYMNDGKGLPGQNMGPSPCDNRGEKILDICKASHMRILNGRFNDITGKLTRFPTKSGDSPSLTLSCPGGGGCSAPPLRFFAHNSEREKDNSTKFGDFPKNI